MKYPVSNVGHRQTGFKCTLINITNKEQTKQASNPFLNFTKPLNLF